MRRTHNKTSSKPHRQTRGIEPGRLTEVRGGGDLWIAVAGGIVVADIMQIQHNEALIRI